MVAVKKTAESASRCEVDVFITQAQSGRQNSLLFGRFIALNQLRDEVKTVVCQARDILLDGINTQRKRVVEIVIVEAGDVNIALQ